MSDVHIHIAGVHQGFLDSILPQVVADLRRDMERVVDANGEDELWRAASGLLGAAFAQGLRFAWSELVAQLIEAGVDVTGSLSVELSPPGGGH